jgi:hypothetical protein
LGIASFGLTLEIGSHDGRESGLSTGPKSTGKLSRSIEYSIRIKALVVMTVSYTPSRLGSMERAVSRRCLLCHMCADLWRQTCDASCYEAHSGARCTARGSRSRAIVYGALRTLVVCEGRLSAGRMIQGQIHTRFLSDGQVKRESCTDAESRETRPFWMLAPVPHARDSPPPLQPLRSKACDRLV